VNMISEPRFVKTFLKVETKNKQDLKGK